MCNQVSGLGNLGKDKNPVPEYFKMTLSVIVFLLFLLAVLPVEAREIIDMAGRKVKVPDRITRVYSTSPPATYMVYALDRSLLVGLNALLKETERKYLSPDIRSLPVLGGYFGQTQVANIELIMKAKPDIVIMWTSKESALNRKMEADMKNLGIPLVFMEINRIDDYSKGLAFLGKLLNREERAKKLVDYGANALKEAAAVSKAIPREKAVLVYYAEGVDGLYTECDMSRHAELINLVGAKNVFRCRVKTDYGMERVPLEKVMLYNPDIIFVQEREAYNLIRQDRRWRQIKAVKDGRVFIIPKAPFNWFDRPPSYMRYLGVKWVMTCLYPELYHIDVAQEVKTFYRLFLDLELNDAQIKEIMAG
jgi:iron complex transport system substrate-binding protein